MKYSFSRRTLLSFLGVAGASATLPFALSAMSGDASKQELNPKSDGEFPVEKSAEEWLQIVGRDRYAVLFEEATERPGSSPLNKEKRTGKYICAACNQPIFSSEAKYESGTGWPSFFRAIDGSIGTKQDFKLVWPRTEYHCSRCGGHQGHLFPDGPEPTGSRYCNNGLALKFIPADEQLPQLRV